MKDRNEKPENADKRKSHRLLKPMWVLFVSPYESTTDQWEPRVFFSLSALLKEIRRCDLTKEYWYCRADELVQILENHDKRTSKWRSTGRM